MYISKLFILSRYFLTASTFVAILVISSQISTADFGILSFFRLTLQYLLYSELGFIQYIFRKRSADGTIGINDLSLILNYLFISIVSICSIFALLDFNYQTFLSNNDHIVYAISATVLGLISKIVIDQLRITKRVNWLVGLEVASNIILYSMVAYAWFSDLHDVDIFIAAYGLMMVPYLIFALFSKVFWQKLKDLKFTLYWDHKIIYGSMMLFLYGFLALLLMSVDRILLKYFVGYEALGLYAMAFTVSAGFYMVIQTILWLNMSNFISDIKKLPLIESRSKFKRHMSKIQIIYFSVITLALPGYYFLITYYNPAYQDTFWIFILLSCYNYINIFYIYHRTYLLTFEKYKTLNGTMLGGIAINFLINYGLLTFNSTEILVVGSVFSHILYMLLIRRAVSNIEQQMVIIE